MKDISFTRYILLLCHKDPIIQANLFEYHPAHTLMKKTLKIIGIGIAGLFILVLIIALIPGSDKKLKETNEGLKETSQKLEQKIQQETNSTPTSPVTEKTWEEKLAQLDTNNPDPDKATVQVFHRQLIRLTAMCEQNDQWVADRIVQGQNSLKKYGVNATLQEIGQGFDDAVVELPSKSCEEAFATYLTGKATGQL